jgi:hypothetical protein
MFAVDDDPFRNLSKGPTMGAAHAQQRATVCLITDRNAARLARNPKPLQV